MSIRVLRERLDSTIPLVDSSAEGDAEVVGTHAAERPEALEGVSHDELGFGVGFGLLMEILHGRHLPALFGILEAIENEDRMLIDAMHGKAPEDDFQPDPREHVQIDCVAVKEMEERVIAGFLEAEGANKTGHSAKIRTEGKGGEDGEEPEKGPLS